MASLTLVEQIDAEIRTNGPMSLATYMGLCLSHPRHGYYAVGRPIGAAGDFITAPELGDLFARSSAGTLAPTLREIGADADMLELGGGSGRFAVAALRELANHSQDLDLDR